MPAWLAMLLAALLWGSAYPVTRFVLADMPPIGAAAWRCLIAFVVLFAVAAWRGELRLPRSAAVWWQLGALGLLGGGIFIIGMNLAVGLTGAAITSFVAGSYPVWTVLLAPSLLSEPITPRVVGAVGIATVGTLLLARPGGADVVAAGVVAALVAAVAMASYLDLARRWAAPGLPGPVVVAMILMLVSVVVCVPIQLVLDPHGLLPTLSARGGLALLWLALAAGALAHLLVNFGVRAMPAGRSAPFMMLVPVSGALIAAILLGERLDALQLLGGALIVAAIALATVRGLDERRRAMAA